MSTFTPMFAEVADKEPTLLAVWSLAGMVCILAFAFSRVRRWGVLVAVLLALLSGFITYGWLRDPHEGPAILRELGRGYFTQAFVAGFLPCLFASFEFLLRRQKHDAA